jgi:hypothetical protein
MTMSKSKYEALKIQCQSDKTKFIVDGIDLSGKLEAKNDKPKFHEIAEI